MIAFVTSDKALELDDDMAPLCGAMLRLGVAHQVVCWDDPDVDWSVYSAVIVRSTWDYHARIDEFRAWIDRLGTSGRIHNSAEVLRWNIDKHYLNDLASAGIPIVPTTFVDDSQVLERMLSASTNLGNVVVKPTVSAGSNDTALHAEDKSAVVHIRELLAKDKIPMVQPYQSAIDEHGEVGLVYMAGEFSHAFFKGPLLGGAVKDRRNALFLEETIRPHTASDEQRVLGDLVLSYMVGRFGSPPLYLRVDTVPGPTGTLLLELEATEPSLFFATSEGSADRFAAKCAALV